ncbi:MAG: rhodanese-like domain-containing protein [Candidatus Moraniibacteriota bacterium]
MKQINQKKQPIVFFILVFLLLTVVFIYFLKNSASNQEKEGQDNLETNSKNQEISDQKPEVLLVSPSEAAKAIRNPKYTLLDIRPHEDYENFHIESSSNYPYEKITEKIPDLDKNKIVIVIESTPTKKGIEIARRMMQKDFEARCLEGGLRNYLQKGYSTVSSGDPSSAIDTAKAEEISKQEILEKINKGEKITLLDVRKKEDFKINHIKNSINIPLEELEKRKKDLPISNIVIIDEDPERSFKAAVRLFDMNILTASYFPDSLQKLKDSQ